MLLKNVKKAIFVIKIHFKESNIITHVNNFFLYFQMSAEALHSEIETKEKPIESKNNGNSIENVTQPLIKPEGTENVEMSTVEKEVLNLKSVRDMEPVCSDNETKNNGNSNDIVTQPEEEIFNCDKCDSVLTALDKLQNHKITKGYLSDALYYCDKENCEYKSCNMQGVYNHKRDIHPKDEDEIFNCDKCGFVVEGRKGERDLERHKQSDGYIKGVKSECLLCDFTCCTTRALQAHVKKIHDNKYDCNKCGAVLGSWSKLKYHKSQKYYCNPGLMKYLSN